MATQHTPMGTNNPQHQQQQRMLHQHEETLKLLEETRFALAEQQRETAGLKAVVNQLSNRPTTSSNNMTSGYDVSNVYNLSTFKEALDSIPAYDGTDMGFIYFAERCEEALNIISPESEESLVKSVRNKLNGDARRAILGMQFKTMSELLEYLRKIYSPRETVYEAQGKLAYMCQRKDESLISYVNRIKELGKRIIDAEKRKTGSVSTTFKETNEENLVNSFIRGLKPEISAKITRGKTLNETIDDAFEADKEIEIIRNIHNLASRNNFDRRNETVYSIQPDPLKCQVCQKTGHIAIDCWLIVNALRPDTRPPRNNNSYNQNRSQNYGPPRNNFPRYNQYSQPRFNQSAVNPNNNNTYRNNYPPQQSYNQRQNFAHSQYNPPERQPQYQQSSLNQYRGNHNYNTPRLQRETGPRNPNSYTNGPNTGWQRPSNPPQHNSLNNRGNQNRLMNPERNVRICQAWEFEEDENKPRYYSESGNEYTCPRQDAAGTEQVARPTPLVPVISDPQELH